MKKIALIGGLMAAASLLSGCMIISANKQGALRRPVVIGGPFHRVGVIFLPRQAGPDSNRPHPDAGPRSASVLTSCLVEKPGYNEPQSDSRNESPDRTRTRGVARL